MLSVDVERQYDASEVPDDLSLSRWASIAYSGEQRAELAVVIVDTDTIWQLNRQYRGKDRPTNVLSFPANIDPIDGSKHLGDIVLCAPIINAEALQQNKTTIAHWAHMTIHGALHLQNYDHIDERDAAVMESLEISLLEKLDYPNPYE